MKNYFKKNVGNSICGFMFGDGEIVNITKYSKGWHEMFNEHKIDEKYKITENFEMFCYLRYWGIDAESCFLEKIRELEGVSKKNK